MDDRRQTTDDGGRLESGAPIVPGDSAMVVPGGGASGWRVRLRAGDPLALDVWTDYGGRCEAARLFIAYRESASGGVLDPAGYSVPPAARGEAGGVEVDACPFEGLAARWRVAAPRPDRPEDIAIDVTLTNRRAELLEIELYAISAVRLKAETVPSLPAVTPLRIARDVIVRAAAPDLVVALGLNGSDAFGLRASWAPLWAEIVSGQGLGNNVTQRPARERYAALATTPLLRPGESRELRVVQTIGSGLDAALAAARDALHADT